MDEFYPLRHHAKGGFKTSYFLPNDHEHLLLTVFSGLVSFRQCLLFILWSLLHG